MTALYDAAHAVIVEWRSGETTVDRMNTLVRQLDDALFRHQTRDGSRCSDSAPREATG